MTQYEYRVLPAPEKGRKAKGVKTPQARFALTVEALMNDMAAEGWEYLRADILPSEERAGLTSSVTEWRSLLVFRRARLDQADAFQPRELPGPEATSAVSAPVPGSAPTPGAAPTKPVARHTDATDDTPGDTPGDTSDGGTEGLGELLKARAAAFMPMPADLGGDARGTTSDADDMDTAPDTTPDTAPDTEEDAPTRS
ncbi:DUF4177 domain-containing protein [Roseivivax sp. CAU 1753]